MGLKRHHGELTRVSVVMPGSDLRELPSALSLMNTPDPGAPVAFEDLAHGDALGVLGRAPSPEQGAHIAEYERGRNGNEDRS